MADPYLDTVRAMGPDVYERMLQALATGQWPDGRVLSDEQREHTMRAVIAWGDLHLPPEQRVGYIDKGHKASGSSDDTQAMTWLDGECK